MKRSNFGLGFRKFELLEPRPFLGQASIAAAEAGEPDLTRALSQLSDAEATEYRSWGAAEKTLFLLGYQYLSVASAKDLTRPDGSPYSGFLPQGLLAAYTILSAASGYLKSMPAGLAQSSDDLSKILKEGTDVVQPNARSLSGKYRLLRDRVAWEMANAGVTVKFDIVGDDPGNPGVIYQRTIGENRTPDLDAVFSFKTPEEMIDAGKDLEQRYADLGLQFDRFKMGDAAAFPILMAIIAVILGILAFFYLFFSHKDRAALSSATVEMIEKDGSLSVAQKADLLIKLKAADSFWGTIFGSFSWTSLIVTAGVAAIAFFAVPDWIEAWRRK